MAYRKRVGKKTTRVVFTVSLYPAAWRMIQAERQRIGFKYGSSTRILTRCVVKALAHKHPKLALELPDWALQK